MSPKYRRLQSKKKALTDDGESLAIDGLKDRLRTLSPVLQAADPGANWFKAIRP